MFGDDFEEVHAIVVHHRAFHDVARAEFGQCTRKAGRNGSKIEVAQVVEAGTADAGSSLSKVLAVFLQGTGDFANFFVHGSGAAFCVPGGQRDEQVLDVHGAALFARKFGEVVVHLLVADGDVCADHAFFHLVLGEGTADLFAEGLAIQPRIFFCLGVEGFFAEAVAVRDLCNGGVYFVIADVEADAFFDLAEDVVHDDAFEQLLAQFGVGEVQAFGDATPLGFDFLCELAAGNGFIVDDEADFVNGLALRGSGRAKGEVLCAAAQGDGGEGEGEGQGVCGFQNSFSSASGVKPWIWSLSIRPERLPMLPSPFRTNSR